MQRKTAQTTQSTRAGECATKPGSPDREGWFEHYYTGILLGLIAIVVTAFLHELPAVTALERLGSDLTQKVNVAGEHALPSDVKLVLLDLDFSQPADPEASEVARITEAIVKLARMEPKAILVDQIIHGTVAPPIMEAFIKAVSQAKDVRVVLLPTPKLVDVDGQHETAEDVPLNELRTATNVRFAAPLVLLDADGVVRSVPKAVCIFWPDKTIETVPSLATSVSQEPHEGCHPSSQALEITFVVPSSLQGSTQALRRITEQDLDNQDSIAPAILTSVVIIGETGPAAWRDRHTTPIGSMPGAIIHANALLTPEEQSIPLPLPFWKEGPLTLLAVLGACFSLWLGYKWRHLNHYGATQGMRLIVIVSLLVSASLAAIVAGVILWSLESLVLDNADMGDAIKLTMEVTTVVLAAMLFAFFAVVMDGLCAVWRQHNWSRSTLLGLRFIGFMVLALVFVTLVATFWTTAGVWFLSHGIRVASLVPAFAAGLEALVKAGGRLMFTLNLAVKLAMRAAALCALAILPWQSASGQVVAPTVQAQGDAEQSPRSRGTVFPSLMAFLQLVSTPAPSQGAASGAGDRLRGSGNTAPMGWLPALPIDQATLPVGAAGLAVVWEGGASPYLVTLAGTTSGDALGSIRTDNRFVWISSFKMPHEAVDLSVRDKEGNRLSATLVPADKAAPVLIPAGEVAQGPVGASLALFVDGGVAWRVEALRQLAWLAPGNEQAAQALAGLRRAAERVSPP